MDSCGSCGIIVYKVTDLRWEVTTSIFTDPCTWITFLGSLYFFDSFQTFTLTWVYVLRIIFTPSHLHIMVLFLFLCFHAYIVKRQVVSWCQVSWYYVTVPTRKHWKRCQHFLFIWAWTQTASSFYVKIMEMLCTFKWRIKRFGHTEGLKRRDIHTAPRVPWKITSLWLNSVRTICSPSIMIQHFSGFSILIVTFHSDWIVVLRIKICFLYYNFTFGWPQYQTSAKKDHREEISRGWLWFHLKQSVSAVRIHTCVTCISTTGMLC